MIAQMTLSTKNLVKRYGRTAALDGFSLDVPVGAVMGLVGPNGAGKTTWMMSVAGLLRTDAGSVSLFGRGPFDPATMAGRLSILPQDSDLPLEMTPESLFVAFARLQGLSLAEARRTAAETLAAVNLVGQAKRPIRTLSHGMRKRVMSGQCFLGDPELVLLDEPMNGLDPEEADRMRRLIRARVGRKTTVISSHNLLDLERLCTHVAFVRAGRVVRVGTIEELTADGRSLEECYLGCRQEERPA